MTPATDFLAMLDLALRERQASTQHLVQTYNLASFDQWMLDEQNARLVFNNSSGYSLALAVQVIGQYDTTTLVWQWAWALGTMPTNVLRAANIAREWGTTNEIPSLTQPTVSMDEADCWKHTALTAQLANWAGIYRGRIDNRYLYLAFAEPLA
jgi:hypothetical protein